MKIVNATKPTASNHIGSNHATSVLIDLDKANAYRAISARSLAMRCAPLALALCATLAHAEVINIDFNGAGSPTFTGQGAFLDRDGNSDASPLQSYWNGVNVPVQGSDPRASGSLLMSDGVTSTGVSVTFNRYYTAVNFPDSPIPASEAKALMQDGALNPGGGSFTLSGLLPQTPYLIVLYGRSPDPSSPLGVNFTFGSRTGGAFVSTYLSQNGSEAQPGATRLASGRDYALVNAKTDALGRLTLLSFFGAVNGMQIVGDFDTRTVFTSETPAAAEGFNDGVPYELGLRIKPNSNGLITSLKFWRPASLPTTETPTGRLYAADGSVLAEVVFPAIATGAAIPTPASGWQQVELPSSIPVEAGKEYVVSVATSGPYAFALQGTANTITNGPISTAGPGSGVFGPVGSIPTASFNNSHYFRDVVFVPTR